MADQKKSSTSRKTSSAGKRKTTSSISSRSKKPASGKGRSSSSANKPFRREAGAVICLLLAIFSAFGYFHMKALFIDFFCGLVKGLFGYGFWLVPPALLLGSYILAFHRGRPVALRLTCALSLPGYLPALFMAF